MSKEDLPCKKDEPLQSTPLKMPQLPFARPRTKPPEKERPTPYLPTGFFPPPHMARTCHQPPAMDSKAPSDELPTEFLQGTYPAGPLPCVYGSIPNSVLASLLWPKETQEKFMDEKPFQVPDWLLDMANRV